MRFLIHIFRAVSYIALLPYLASAISASFATCMPRDSFSGAALAGITFLIIIGYGNTLTQKDPIPVDSTFWVSTIVFYIAFPSFVISRSSDRFFRQLETSLTDFYEAFIPHFEPYLALSSVGGLSFVALVIWMPVAAVLSLFVFVNLLRQQRRESHGTILKTSVDQDASSKGSSPF